MATLPIISNVYRVAFNWADSGGQIAANVMHFRKATSSASAIASAIDANISSAMWTPVSTTSRVVNLKVTPLDGTSATFVLNVTGAKWTGSSVGNFVPQAAVVVSMRSALRGRRNRGRFFIPFIGEPYIANGVVDTSVVPTLQTAWEAFRSVMAGAGATPITIASYGRNPATLKHPLQTWSPFDNLCTSLAIEPNAGTQRRRQSRLWH